MLLMIALLCNSHIKLTLKWCDLPHICLVPWLFMNCLLSFIVSYTSYIPIPYLWIVCYLYCLLYIIYTNTSIIIRGGHFFCPPIVYYCPKFTVFTDNNPLTYVLTRAKLNATGLRWVGELSDFNFDSKSLPGLRNTDADSLSRLPGHFEQYMSSCTRTVSQEELHATITSVRALGNGDSIWLASFTTDGELLADDEALRSLNPRCSQINTVDIAREQDNDKNVRRIKEDFTF